MYRVKWSPFADDVFVSCGGDWRVAVWQQDRSYPVLGFQPSNVRCAPLLSHLVSLTHSERETLLYYKVTVHVFVRVRVARNCSQHSYTVLL